MQAAKRLQNAYNMRLGMAQVKNSDNNAEASAKMGRDFHSRYGTLYAQRNVPRPNNSVQLPSDLVSWLQREKEAHKSRTDQVC